MLCAALLAALSITASSTLTSMLSRRLQASSVSSIVNDQKLSSWIPPALFGIILVVDLMQILRVDEELNLIVVIGSVPGKPGNLLEIAPAKIVGKNC